MYGYVVHVVLTLVFVSSGVASGFHRGHDTVTLVEVLFDE